MLQITKKELLTKYGIDLEKGQYTVENVGNSYKINTVKDDTSGCPLVGTAVQGDKLLHSKVALTQLLTLMSKAVKNKEKLSIEVINPEKAPPLKPKAQRKLETKVEPAVEPAKVDSVVVEPVKLPEATPVVVEQIKQPLIKLIIQWIRNNIFKN